jgi:hypothetical protein
MPMGARNSRQGEELRVPARPGEQEEKENNPCTRCAHSAYYLFEITNILVQSIMGATENLIS